MKPRARERRRVMLAILSHSNRSALRRPDPEINPVRERDLTLALSAGLAEAGTSARGEIRIVFDMTAGTDWPAGAVIAEDLA
jgi:hypothetical protein